jgi:glycosyltransferase involved in cell wall biosynthesis
MTLKVCFLTGEYPPMQGGIADHTSHLARHLVELGTEVTVLTSTKAAVGSDTKRPIWVRESVNEPRSIVQVYPVISGWSLGCWRQINRWLEEHAPHVFHIQYQAAAYDLGGWINWFPWRLRLQNTCPRVVVTFHDLRVPYLFPKAGRLRWRSILALARHSDAVVATNVGDEHVLRKALSFGELGDRGIRKPWNRGKGLLGRLIPHSPVPGILTLIPLGGNLAPQPPLDYDRDRWRDAIGLDKHTLLLAYFGFLNESKGGEDLVLTLEQLARRGYDAHLLMIGGQVGDVDPTNRAYAQRVRSLVQTSGLVDRVHWTGYTSSEEVSANLLAADVMVMPYRDGVSFRRTTFIAALSHGRPVVTTRPAVPLPELRDGENVLLVPPRDVAALADSVARLAGDADLCTRISAGAEALGKRFDWSIISQQTLDLYRRLELE